MTMFPVKVLAIAAAAYLGGSNAQNVTPVVPQENPWPHSSDGKLGIVKNKVINDEITSSDPDRLLKCKLPIIQDKDVVAVQKYLTGDFVKQLSKVLKTKVSYDNDEVPELKVKVSSLKKLLRSKEMKYSIPKAARTVLNQFVKEADTYKISSSRTKVIVFQNQNPGQEAQNPVPHRHKKFTDVGPYGKQELFGPAVFLSSITKEAGQTTTVFSQGTVADQEVSGPVETMRVSAARGFRAVRNAMCVFSGRAVHSGPSSSQTPNSQRVLIAMNDIPEALASIFDGLY